MALNRKRISSGAPWEKKVGYSRAIKVGPIIKVSGTTAVDGEKIIAPGDAFAQSMFIFNKIEETLKSLGAGLDAVVATRMYVTDISNWEKVGEAHGSFFRELRPAATMVEVSALIHPDLLVEIEVEAYAE